MKTFWGQAYQDAQTINAVLRGEKVLLVSPDQKSAKREADRLAKLFRKVVTK
jgi:hypothetical protein